MKSAMAISAVFLIMFSALAVADSCYGDDSEDFDNYEFGTSCDFDDGTFGYKVIEGTDDVEICELNPYYHNELLTINPTVTHDAETYDIVSLNLSMECDRIKTVSIPQSVTRINDGCFNSLPSLISINVNDFNVNFKSIYGVLYEMKNGVEHKLVKCPMNNTINPEHPGTIFDTMPSTVAEIGYTAFSATSFTTIILGDGVIKIGMNAFASCTELEHINSSLGADTLPDSVSSIGSSAFCNCPNLRQLKLPSDLEYIGSSAFEYSGITSMEIPFNVDYIGICAFSNCPNLERFTSNNLSYIEEDGILFVLGSNGAKSLFAYPAAKDSVKYTIPEDVTEICDSAFSGCTHLEEIVLNDRFATIGDGAFAYCTSLRTIDIRDIVSIGVASFYGCENLTSIEFGKDLTTIGDAAFEYCGLQSVYIPANVLYIGYNVFQNCKDLTEVKISEGSKVKLMPYVFYDDTSLEKISIGSSDVVLTEGSLTISFEEQEPFILNVEVVKGYSIPDDAANEYTKLNISIIGERPYPWENWIGVFFCVLVIIGILWAVREV